MRKTCVILNRKMEEAPEDDDFVDEGEDEVDIDDEFEDLEEEDFEENNDSGSNDTGV